MKLQFIGGAHEVGGSSTFVQVGEKRVVVDCGIRMGGAETDRLPDLAAIQEHGYIDAIVVTHAHTDHIGALPLLHLAYPEAPIYTTEPTLELMRILLADSLKIMEARWLQEQEIPLYPEHAVLAMLSRVRAVPLDETVSVCEDEIQLTFRLSGHVLGACSVTMDTREGRILFMGDYSLDPQRTVDGFLLPPVRPHVLISEATYGNRMHANRRSEESRLAENVAGVIAAGGKVLIPAFALGRAQEVLLILMHEQKVGRIPQFPLYVDGMVKNICQVYAHFPAFLGERLRKRVEKHGNPFFFEGSPAVAVSSKNRQSIVDGSPCCIISSSGMLTGGPSQWYAAQLAPDPKNAIFITGYQDEESPGRRVLAVAEGKERTLSLCGQTVALECRVEKYGLSAHADAGQMATLIAKLDPHTSYLVHGDEGARTGLLRVLPPNLRVQRPRNGDVFEHSFSSTLTKGRERRPKEQPGLAAGRSLHPDLLRDSLLQKGLANRSFTVEELAGEWFGPGATEPDLAAMRELFRANLPSGFSRDPRRPALLRLHGKNQSREHTWQSKPKSALGLARQMFANYSDYKSIGERLASRELIFSVPFPGVFRRRHAERLAELESKTGFTIQLKAADTPRALAEAARTLLPPGWKVTKPPSIHAGQHVTLRVRMPENTSLELQKDYCQRFCEETGHTLDLSLVTESETPAAPRELFGPDGKMETNAAYRTVRNAFAEAGIEVYRCGRKTDPISGLEYLEVSLLTPWLAESHTELLERLQTTTGYPLRIATGINQAALEQWLREQMPPSWTWLRLPKFFPDKRQVVLSLTEEPRSMEVTDLTVRLQQLAGMQLTLER